MGWMEGCVSVGRCERGAGPNPSLLPSNIFKKTDYDKRKGTLREWIKEQKAKNPDWQVRASVGRGVGLIDLISQFFWGVGCGWSGHSIVHS